MSILKTLGAAVLGGLVVLAGLTLAPASSKLGGVVNEASYLVGDVYQGLRQTLAFRDGVLKAPVSTDSVTIGSGTAVTKYSCATATWNPPAIGTSSVALAATSTDIALSGSVVGDTCSASLSSATSSDARLGCVIAANATATLQVQNLGSASLDLATGTAKVCYTH